MSLSVIINTTHLDERDRSGRAAEIPVVVVPCFGCHLGRQCALKCLEGEGLEIEDANGAGHFWFVAATLHGRFERYILTFAETSVLEKQDADNHGHYHTAAPL